MFLLISCPVAPVRTVHPCCVSDLMQLQLGDTGHYKNIIFLPDCMNNKNIFCDLHQASFQRILYFLNMFIL